MTVVHCPHDAMVMHSVHSQQNSIRSLRNNDDHHYTNMVVMDAWNLRRPGGLIASNTGSPFYFFYERLKTHKTQLVKKRGDRWQKFTGKKAHREDGVAWDEIKAGVSDGKTS